MITIRKRQHLPRHLQHLTTLLNQLRQPRPNPTTNRPIRHTNPLPMTTLMTQRPNTHPPLTILPDHSTTQPRLPQNTRHNIIPSHYATPATRTANTVNPRSTNHLRNPSSSTHPSNSNSTSGADAGTRNQIDLSDASTANTPVHNRTSSNGTRT
jgi:hypothetical protein